MMCSSAHAAPHPTATGNLSTEQKAVLSRKEKEITAARTQASKGASKRGQKAPNRRLSDWQQKLDKDQLDQLSK